MGHFERTAPNIASADWIQSPATQRVFSLLNQQSFVGRAVGGCVRNSLLAQLDNDGSGPTTAVTDIDFATTATPSETMELAAEAGLRTVATGLQHGTVTIIVDGEGFEVTTLRRDVATDGRHADVAFTDNWTFDAQRRDLTINALYAEADGSIFDPLGGLDDIYNKRVRFVGDARRRIQEDYLRILRFFRFFAQYGKGQPDADGIEACVAERRGLARLSCERIHQELIKLLASPGAAQTLVIMADHGLLTEILPTVPQVARVRRLIAAAPNCDNALRLAALSILVEEDADRIAKHLRLSRNEFAALKLAANIQAPATFENVDTAFARRLLYNLGSEDYFRSLAFLRALRPGILPDQQWRKLIELPENWQPPVFPITGRDLIGLGLSTGPKIGEVIQTLQQSWLNSDFELGRDALMADAQTLITRSN